jgi:hypothetical protein
MTVVHFLPYILYFCMYCIYFVVSNVLFFPDPISCFQCQSALEYSPNVGVNGGGNLSVAVRRDYQQPVVSRNSWLVNPRTLDRRKKKPSVQPTKTIMRGMTIVVSHATCGNMFPQQIITHLTELPRGRRSSHLAWAWKASTSIGPQLRKASEPLYFQCVTHSEGAKWQRGETLQLAVTNSCHADARSI